MEIWNTLSPSSGSSTFCTLASPYPRGAIASRTWSTDALRSTGVLIRVPDSKSMPNFSPGPAMASAPITRIMPEIEKKIFELPTKSKCEKRCFSPVAPIAKRDPIRRVRAMAPRMAEVASTAVNSDTMTPMPSVNAKPLIPAVASVNRMNATPIVTTFASMIVRSAFA